MFYLYSEVGYKPVMLQHLTHFLSVWQQSDVRYLAATSELDKIASS